jgi:hypothetical protein
MRIHAFSCPTFQRCLVTLTQKQFHYAERSSFFITFTTSPSIAFAFSKPREPWAQN